VNQINGQSPAGILAPIVPPGQGIRVFLQPATRHERPAATKDTHMPDDDDDIPFMQKLLDNHFLLLFLGVASPGLIYILWGIIDIMNTPIAR
jgi:hypothetical protein